MAIALVQSNSGAGTTATVSPAFATASTSGNLLVLCFTSDDYNGTPTSGWTQSAEMEQQGFHGSYLWWRISAGETTLSYTIGSAVGSAWVLMEFSGVLATPYDISEGILTNSTDNNYATDPITPTAGSRLIVTSIGTSGDGTQGQSTTFTNSFISVRTAVSAVGATRDAVTTAYRLVTADGATSYSTATNWDPAGGPAQSRSALAIAFKADTGPTDAFFAAGTAGTAASGNVTPTLPASLATNDALVLSITALDNVACSVATSGGSGNAWALKGAQNNGTGLRTEVWWKRRGASDADTGAVVTHASGGKIIARIYAVRVPGTGDPFEAFGFNTAAAATSADFPNATTLTASATMMFGLSYAEDFLVGPSISNAQGLTLTERGETEFS